MIKIFKTINSVVKVAAPNLRVYIPNSYFEEGIAEYVGSNIETLAIFYMSIHKNDTEAVTLSSLHSLKLPATITIYATKKEKQKLRLGDIEEMYTVLHFYEDEVFLPSTRTVQNTVQNTLNFINLLHYGKLPQNIKYEEIINIYRKNLELNKVNLKVPSVLLESIISELCRSKKDRNIPYRLDKTMSGFSYAPIKMLPHLNSTFASLSFEDPNKGIALSIKRTRENKEQALSPIEKVIKY